MGNKENVTEKIGYKDILKQREFMKIVSASLINRFGDSIDAIAFTWMVYMITKSAAWSALVFAVNQLPSVLVQPFAGAMVEKMNKKRLMVTTDVIRGIITAGLAVFYLANALNPWILLLFTLINSTVEAFRLPASLAVVPKILEERYYEYGTALNSTLSMVVQLIGLGTAGVVIGALGIGTAIAIDGISFFGSAFILSLLKIKEEKPASGTVDPGSVKAGTGEQAEKVSKDKQQIKEYIFILKDGFVYLKKQPVIRNFCLLAVLINAIIVPINSLQTPLVQEVLGQGSGLLSVFSLALTVGMGIGSFVYPFLSGKFSVRTQFAGSGVLLGISMYSYTWGERFQTFTVGIYALTIAASFLLGVSCSILTSALSVQFMKAVDREYLARVGATFNAGASAATPAASFAGGVLAAFCPVSQIFRLCALLCVIIFLMIGLAKIRLE